MILLLLACDGKDGTGDNGGETGGDTSGETGGDTSGETGGDTSGETGGDFCDEAPVVTFETFGAGFITENCQACHATTAPNRNGAPYDVVFDAGDGQVDVDACWAWADRILVRAASDPPTMPPMGGTTEDDRYRLEVWLTCADEGT